MSRYIVKLTPQGKYFFGGDMTFSAKSMKDKQFESYIISSFKMPQQTSLLGMLRFLLLSHDTEAFDIEGNHIKSKDAADLLIGKKSFSVNDEHGRNDFGKIVGIGSCCLYDKTNDKYYFKAFPNDDLKADFTKADKVTVNGRELEIPKIKRKDGKEYSPKEPLSKEYVSDDDKTANPFIEDDRIGIQKDYEGKTKDKSLYKQINYRLEKGFCFAFEAKVDDIDLAEYSGEIVKLGADASTFLLEAEKTEADMPYMKAGSETELVLLSDAYLEKPLEREGVLFAITTTKPFRFLSCENSERASDYNVRYRWIRSEKRYDLYEAGSVFYFKDKESRSKFCEYIDSYKDFAQIGYNKYCETK